MWVKREEKDMHMHTHTCTRDVYNYVGKCTHNNIREALEKLVEVEACA